MPMQSSIQTIACMRQPSGTPLQWLIFRCAVSSTMTSLLLSWKAMVWVPSLPLAIENISSLYLISEESFSPNTLLAFRSTKHSPPGCCQGDLLRCQLRLLWMVQSMLSVVNMLNSPFSQLTISRLSMELRQATGEPTYDEILVTMICYFSLATTGKPSTLPLSVPKKYHSQLLLTKKQLETTGCSSCKSSKQFTIGRPRYAPTTISSQIFCDLSASSFSPTIRICSVRSASTSFLYEITAGSLLILSIAAVSILAALALLLSQLPTSRCPQSNRAAMLNLQILDCLSMSYNYCLALTLPFLSTLQESMAGCRLSTIFIDHESTMQTVLSPKQSRNRHSCQFSTSPSTFSGSSPCWLTFLQSPSSMVMTRMRSSLCTVTILSLSSSLVTSLNGVTIKSMSPSVSARAEHTTWYSGSRPGSFHPTSSPLSPAVTKCLRESLPLRGMWYRRGFEPI